jgi:Ala-tRNA(Pro) deacylase
MTMPCRVQTYLEQHGVDYELVPHRKVFTSQAAAWQANIDGDHLAKGVLLKADGSYTLALIPSDHWLRLKAISRELDRPFEIAPEAELAALFDDCDPGAVPAVGPAYGIETVVDEALDTLGVVYFESGDHEQLVRVDGTAFRALLRGARHGHFTSYH